jgi:hypothetical protein
MPIYFVLSMGVLPSVLSRRIKAYSEKGRRLIMR